MFNMDFKFKLKSFRISVNMKNNSHGFQIFLKFISQLKKRIKVYKRYHNDFFKFQCQQSLIGLRFKWFQYIRQNVLFKFSAIFTISLWFQRVEMYNPRKITVSLFYVSMKEWKSWYCIYCVAWFQSLKLMHRKR